MSYNAFKIVKDFEDAVAEYTGAPYCVAVNSCTNALFLCLEYHMQNNLYYCDDHGNSFVEIPNKTYVSVPMQIKHAGYTYVKFRDENWMGAYRLNPMNIWDAARRFTSDMFMYIRDKDYFYINVPIKNPHYVCVSFHWSKILGIQQGGAILHNNPEFDIWARKARFDGRTEGIRPKDDEFNMLGYHMYMSPEIAAEGLVRLMHLPKNNPDLPNDDYPDLSKLEIFK